MTVFTLGQATLRALGSMTGTRKPSRCGTPHRTGAPVLRDSIEAGTFEDMFFMVPAKGETDKLLRIARRTLDAGRQLRREARSGVRTLTVVERRIAALTAAAVRVYEEILTLARLNRGQVFPSYDHLSGATSLGRATIARTLRILENLGFLVRQRRFKRIEAEGPGPRYRQTSNVYRPTLPQSVLAYLPRWMRPAPLPDDVAQQENDRAADMARMRAGLSCRDLAKVTVGGPLGKMLEKLGAGIDRLERESQNGPQPHTHLI
ncbi:helix-turn-helix domain-containing protein [Sphingomonas sp. PP-CC-3A-396]|uniref:helix-turn-helix domain-containing protein n=1 Tax=Sphingomonas sp. PP-CC-3A-396 TaxID=2135655 RepID=UPI0010494BDA|nr:helix-turn-helix domain-containing protein [Sphingomonas sp. PP-CC-3A-396]TCQ02835.1 helix-turn-helix protein [Sphingomonas sp. PP-CC-3A-396]